MQGVPDQDSVGYWLVGFFWGMAALCYLFDGAAELIISLLSLGALTAIAKYVMRNEA